jgi:RNA polymerase sigma-70 factor (ECF subfamily)
MEARALVGVLITDRARFVRLARLRVPTEADAEDVVQRALLRAAERSESLEAPAQARAWFYRILHRAIADHHRSRRADPLRIPASADLDEIATEPPATTAVCACGLRLLAELRPAYAEVIRRVDVNGEDAGEVARSLGISAGNLHVRLHRARRALREDVQHHCGVDSLAPCLDCGCSGPHRCGGEA